MAHVIVILVTDEGMAHMQWVRNIKEVDGAADKINEALDDVAREEDSSKKSVLLENE